MSGLEKFIEDIFIKSELDSDRATRTSPNFFEPTPTRDLRNLFTERRPIEPSLRIKRGGYFNPPREWETYFNPPIIKIPPKKSIIDKIPKKGTIAENLIPSESDTSFHLIGTNPLQHLSSQLDYARGIVKALFLNPAYLESEARELVRQYDGANSKFIHPSENVLRAAAVMQFHAAARRLAYGLSAYYSGLTEMPIGARGKDLRHFVDERVQRTDWCPSQLLQTFEGASFEDMYVDIVASRAQKLLETRQSMAGHSFGSIPILKSLNVYG